MMDYIVIFSACFILFASDIQRIFQDWNVLPVSLLIKRPILGIFPYSVYIVLLGAGIIAYPLFIYLVQKTKIFSLHIKLQSPFTIQS